MSRLPRRSGPVEPGSGGRISRCLEFRRVEVGLEVGLEIDRAAELQEAATEQRRGTKPRGSIRGVDTLWGTAVEQIVDIEIADNPSMTDANDLRQPNVCLIQPLIEDGPLRRV